jgi:hypothetical protein
MVFVVISPFAFLVLLIWVFSSPHFSRFARGLSILFIFSKNQLFVLLILVESRLEEGNEDISTIVLYILWAGFSTALAAE